MGAKSASRAVIDSITYVFSIKGFVQLPPPPPIYFSSLNPLFKRVLCVTAKWAEAEQLKRNIEDQLSGREVKQDAEAHGLPSAIETSLKDKRVQEVSGGVLGKYERELERLWKFCQAKGAYTVQGITRELLTDFAGTWAEAYPSSTTRAKCERLRSFLRYCYEAQWLPLIPQVPKIKIDEPPTIPLTGEVHAVAGRGLRG
jgi:hypothetical protein